MSEGLLSSCSFESYTTQQSTYIVRPHNNVYSASICPEGSTTNDSVTVHRREE